MQIRSLSEVKEMTKFLDTYGVLGYRKEQLEALKELIAMKENMTKEAVNANVSQIKLLNQKMRRNGKS